MSEETCNKILNVIIEPTADCNMNCQYCFKGEKKEITMSIDLLKSAINQILPYVEKRNLSCEFIWHGGEPSLMGYDYFNEAIIFIEEMKGKSNITYSFQTNGTLLDDKLLELFLRYNVYVGISLDNTLSEYHDKMRPLKDGNSSYQVIIDGIKRTKSKGIDVGVLMALTEENAYNAIDMFKFCQTLGVGLGLNPVSADSHSSHSEIELSPETYLNVCTTIFDLWLVQKNTPIRFNPAFGIIENIIKQNSDKHFKKNCQNTYVSISPEGDIYPCNRFYGVDKFKFGNIVDGFEKAMNSDVRKNLLSRSTNKIKKCSKCSISSFCNSGCMHHAYSHYNTVFAPDHLCKVYQGLVDHAIKRLTEIVTSFPKSMVTIN